MNFLTAHSEAGAKIMLASGYKLRQIEWVGDGFEYVFEIPALLPDGREHFPGSGLPASDNVAEGVRNVSVAIFADKPDAEKNAPGVNEVLRVSVTYALPNHVHLGENFEGSFRLDFERVFHGGIVVRGTIERQEPTEGK